jgi:hypothetical protein
VRLWKSRKKWKNTREDELQRCDCSCLMAESLTRWYLTAPRVAGGFTRLMWHFSHLWSRRCASCYATNVCLISGTSAHNHHVCMVVFLIVAGVVGVHCMVHEMVNNVVDTFPTWRTRHRALHTILASSRSSKTEQEDSDTLMHAHSR